MIRIGKLTDYAMLVLGDMAKLPEVVQSATFLADRLHLSPTTVSKVLKTLAESGLVSSVRGAEGGYRLARGAAEITVADVIMAMEGGFALTECCENKELCAIDTMCGMKESWLKINNMVRTLLSRFTILDMHSPLALDKALEEVSNG